MATNTNLPLAFGTLLVGGLLIDRGAKAVNAALGGSSSSSSQGSSSSSKGAGKPAGGWKVTPSKVGTLPAKGGPQVGLVSTAALEAVGKLHGWSGQQISDWMSIHRR